jgi:hypothetical protein
MTTFIPLTDASVQVLVKNLKSKIIACGPIINSSQIETILEQWTQASAEASKAAAFIERARQKTQETLIRIAADKLSPSEERLAQFLRHAVTVKMLRKAHLDIATAQLKADISCEEEAMKEFNRAFENRDIAYEYKCNYIDDISCSFYSIENMLEIMLDEVKKKETKENFNRDIVMILRKVRKTKKVIRYIQRKAEKDENLADNECYITANVVMNSIKEYFGVTSKYIQNSTKYVVRVPENIRTGDCFKANLGGKLVWLRFSPSSCPWSRRYIETYENGMILPYRINIFRRQDAQSQKQEVAIKKAERRQKRREEKEKEVNAYWDLEHYWSSRTAIEI